MTILDALIYFPVYSFLGWCLEVSYQAVSKGLVVNRGFLNGPVCPIYGVGVIGSVLIVETLFGTDVGKVPGIMLFIFGTLFATAIELASGWLLDRLFHARWWDYRDRRFNLNGYICLEFSLIWGIGMVFVLREIYPFIARVLGFIKPGTAVYVILAMVYGVFVIDIAVSAMIVAGMDRKFREIDELQKRMRHVSDSLSSRIGEDTIERKEHIEERTLETKGAIEEHLADRRESLEDLMDELEKKLAERRRRVEMIAESHKLIGAGRVLRAYPGIRHKKYDDILMELKRYLENQPK